MLKQMKGTSTLLLGFALAGAVALSAPPLSAASTQAASSSSSQNDAAVQAQVAKELGSKNFKDVQIAVKDGVITLSGTVGLFGYKEQADQKVHHKFKHLALRNEIEVAGAEMSDAQLQQELAKKIAYDRVGYGTTTFNAITVSVQNGVVTLGGNVYWQPDRDSAVGLVAYTPGVKDVVDNVQVDPVSPFDDQIRIAVARSIYGFPMLNQYAIDPAKPIRITVINGNVTLSGVVDSQADKDAAGIRANIVPNVFKVTNNLQVAGQRQ